MKGSGTLARKGNVSLLTHLEQEVYVFADKPRISSHCETKAKAMQMAAQWVPQLRAHSPAVAVSPTALAEAPTLPQR